MESSKIHPVLKPIYFLNEIIENRVREHGEQYMAFAIFGLINYILPFFMWSEDMIETAFPLYIRSFASLFCFILLLKDHWPNSLRKWLPLYWYFTLLYTLPFLTSYLLFYNHGSTNWLMNMVLALFLLVLLVDWISFVVLLSLGVSLALVLYRIMHGSIFILVDMNNLYLAFYMYFFAILIGLIFSRNKAKIDFERLSAMQGLSASIAHEIRTPLSSLRMNTKLIRMYLPKLIKFYDKNKQNEDASAILIRPEHEKKLKKVSADIEATIQKSFLIVEMLLANIKVFKDESIILTKLDMSECLNEALQAYPFRKDQEKMIHVDPSIKFEFLGNPIMVRHIFYNLIKNALHYINDVDLPKIEIWVETSLDEHLLYFKDNGGGIKDVDLPYIFDQFYSKRKHGTGVGLSFCKLAMKKFGGNIACTSESGEYAQFMLGFPKI